ncbi:MAG: hypothetical protein ABL908_21525 [Hyphomicrobium sp.]
MMIFHSKLAAAAAVAAGVTIATGLVLATSGDASAASCRPAISGSGTGQGILGKGTQRARAAATSEWEAKAKSRHGWKFGKLGKASDVNWDCKSLPLKAKCVVTAKPCR